MNEFGDNVRLKKLLHEMKTSYPVLPDDVIRDYVKQYGNDMPYCRNVLMQESERYLNLHGGPAYKRITSPSGEGTALQQNRRFSLKALLDQQMRRHLMLSDEYDKEVQHLNSLRDENNMLLSAVGIRRECIKSEVNPEKHLALKEEVQSLEGSCSDLKIRINSIKGAILRKPESESETMTKPTTLRSPVEAMVKAAFVNLASPGLSSSLEHCDAPPGSEEEQMWECSKCTFFNHAALKSCEVCDMPRFTVGTDHSITHPDSPCFCHPQEFQQTEDSSRN